MTQAKKKSSNLASMLISDRFSGEVKPKKFIQRNSVTEFTSLSMLNEKLTIENKVISNSKQEASRKNEIEIKYQEILETINFELSIPPRVPYTLIDPEDYKAVEAYVFNHWKYLKNDKIFERNIELWRQFWITCERSDTIAQIIDARDPLKYFNRDILRMYPDKIHVVLMNKCDLVMNIQKSIDMLHSIIGVQDKITSIFQYSTKNPVYEFDFAGTVGLIGYPNVGKSSTINMILNQKKVRVSSTPGKTKFIQTIVTPNFTLLDCPGLVFPSHNKIELVLMGILNIDQIPDLSKYEKYIIEGIGVERLMSFYKLYDFDGDFLTNMSIQKGWIKSKCLKIITKDYAMGNMPCW